MEQMDSVECYHAYSAAIILISANRAQLAMSFGVWRIYDHTVAFLCAIVEKQHR